MGSKSSGSSSGEDKYGEWKKDSCNCKDEKGKNIGENTVYDDDKVIEIYWESTHLVNSSVRILSDIPRLGIGQRLVHGYVKTYIECSKCHNTKYVTFEYGGYGKIRRIGKYNKVYKNYDSYKPSSMNLKKVLDIFHNISGFKEDDYDLVSNNCQHFAKKFYIKILWGYDWNYIWRNNIRQKG